MNITTIQKISLGLAITLWIAGLNGSLAWGAAERQNQTTPQVGMLLAQAGEPTSSSTSGPRISSLATSIGPDGETVITIQSTGVIQYTAFKLLNPLRLVLDFPNMKKGGLSDSLTVDQGVVDRIRTLYFQEADVLRLEIVLNQATDYDIRKPANTRLTIHLNKTATKLAQAETPALTAKSESGNASAPAAETKAEQTTAVNVDPCEALLGGEKDRIDLDFQGITLQNIFRIFSEVSGFNLIIAQGVTGKVNIRLYDVPWNKAFQIILDNNGLGARCIGDNIVRVATIANLTAESVALAAAEEERARAQVAIAASGELITEVRRISYATISEISANLKPLTSVRGRVTVDARTNTLILTDVKANVDAMLKLIDVLDAKTAQVMIEARIVEISRSFSQELGIQWGLTGKLSSSQGGQATTFMEQAEIRSLTGAASADGIGQFLVDLATTTTATSGIGFLLGNVIGGLDLDLQLTALEATGRGRILSAPRVTTMDNRQAKISSGRTIPFETTSADGTSTQFVDAELSLTVTPRITADDHVFMIIDATKNAADFTNKDGNGNPTITTKEAHAEVIVANGDTTVLGGIFEDDRQESEQRVPFLADIPLLGLLFQNSFDKDTINELLIFVTPTIIRDR
ncbi:MAG: type IV pilus secretin PilQ [Nitrospinae bacterium]|nr:type IV pilus secretin PilQ [Nitrospinota bacterium]